MKAKTFVIALLFVVIIVSIYFLWKMFGSSGEDEIYLIPNNFKGIITIIFNVKDGQNVRYENGKRIYQIPENGILKTQFSFNEGFHQENFYYDDKDNLRKEILFDALNKTNSEEIQILKSVSGVSNNGNGTKEVRYHQFIVCKRSELDSLSKVEKRLNITDF